MSIYFLDIFKKKLKSKNITQYKFSKKINVPTSLTTLWYNGKSKPSCDNTIKLIKELDMVPDLFPEYLHKDNINEVEKILSDPEKEPKEKCELALKHLKKILK